MGDGIETLLPAMLEALTFLLDNGYLRAADLVNLEASSRLFWAPSGIEPYESMSIAASAARRSSEKHPVFAGLQAQARSGLLARCDGNWKLVLHFLESSERSSGPGRSTGGNAGSNVRIAVDVLFFCS